MLQKRGLPNPAASVVAELGYLAFRNAFNRWIDPADHRDFADIARQELETLRSVATELG